MSKFLKTLRIDPSLIKEIKPCVYEIPIGFVPNMKVPGQFFSTPEMAKLAFEELQSMIQLIQAVCSGTRPSFKDVNLPENFQNLIKRCWDNNPDLRPTFREIQHELRKNVILNNVNMDVYKAYISKLPRHRSHS